ncbi:MAG: DNA mismatch repair protein MutS [Lachnospiraceae bacterium]|nr:DNA mismatch repair protein MutS [Lachnospiraceae bacterium]
MSKLSPMMEHYLDTKKEYKDAILFYRLGDFYEMFFDDALTASKEIELTLTGKDCGMEERAPMCGVPYHAADTYINRLVEKGYKVAIAEQMEDPKLAKGLVKREVIRVVTPGTNLSTEALSDEKNNYLMTGCYFNFRYGIAVCDLSTGEFKCVSISDAGKVCDEIAKLSPSELMYGENFFAAGLDLGDLPDKLGILTEQAPAHYFNLESCESELKRHFAVSSIEGLGIKDYDELVLSCGAMLKYLHETQKDSLKHINTLTLYNVDEYMIIDSVAMRNLELVETMRDKQKRGSLLSVLDKTKTAMGARMLKTFVTQPLLKAGEINRRYDIIDAFNSSMMDRDEVREYLNTIYDLERLMTRISLRTANPRDMLAFKTSIKYLPDIKRTLKSFANPILDELSEQLDGLEDIHTLLEDTISEDAPITVHEGGIFKEGYLPEIDELRNAKTECKNWLADLETKEREKTGIKGLKIKYNKVFDYYFEVTNSFKSLVPDYFIRKQTLVNAERYTTEELNSLSDKILGAEDRLHSLEYEKFSQIRDNVGAQLGRVKATAREIAYIDALISLAYVAYKNNYVRPELNDEGVIDIKNGRHPVVELNLPSGTFVENDTYLDCGDRAVSIITGPNMAGKSTYMRQTALITLMAQIGSFVPAQSANIGLCDRIFTRVGASDDLASGQSTFMIEMNEVANIIRNATSKSLIILDEIGRGTSTFDGLSIAWAVCEYIADKNMIGARTLFATHYHELTELEGRLPSVHNFCISVKEEGDNIVFLRKIIPGGASRSYGIQVARLAGVPEPVLKRAHEILAELIASDISQNAKKVSEGSFDKREAYDQISLSITSSEDVVKREILDLDLDNMTPMQAFKYLNELKARIKLS